jgi:hypothetical protein
VPIYAVNVPVGSYQEVVLCAYHFLSYCAQFPIVFTNTPNFAASVVLETSQGVINAASPSRLFASSAVFLPSHVGNYVAVRDPLNPSNTCMVAITAYISATEVQCNAPVANFQTSATGVYLRIFDSGATMAANNYFVFSAPTGSTPGWQASCRADGVSTTAAYELAPIGGFDPLTETWLGPVSPYYYGWTTVAQAFFVVDTTQHWFFTWTEDTGGVLSNRCATWLGTTGSTHATPATGFPSDTSFAGILGTDGAPVNHNINRSTAVDTYLSSGHFGNDDGSGVIRGYMLVRQTLSTTTDILTMGAAAVNPRTAVTDDYDVVLGHRSPKAIRGYVPGLRMLSDTVVNRTLISGGATYALGNGFGLAWNGKPIV